MLTLFNPGAPPGDSMEAFLRLVEPDAIAAGCVRVHCDTTTEGAAVVATMRGNDPCFINGVLQNQDVPRTTTTDENDEWHLDLKLLPETHFWEIAVFSKRVKILLTSAMVGTIVEFEDVIVKSGC